MTYVIALYNIKNKLTRILIFTIIHKCKIYFTCFFVLFVLFEAYVYRLSFALVLY